MIKFITLTYCVLIGSLVQAQFNVPYTTTIRTPYGNQKITSYHPSAPMYPYRYGSTIVSSKYKFTVVLRNDSSFVANTKIDMETKTHALLVKTKSGKQTVFPRDTKEIYRTDINGVKISGIPTDSCWLFQCGKGKINTYSSFAEKGTMYAIAFPEGDSDPMQPITKDALLGIMGGDPKLKKLSEQGEEIKAIDLYNANL
jgi:hypothetical protein